MAKSTGYKINGFYATDYAGVIEAMRFSKVQVAWFGNKSGMEAVDRASGEVFRPGRIRRREPRLLLHIIVHKDSPYNKLEDVLKCDKTLDFGIGDPNSTSGFLVPTAYIFAAKSVDPKSCFKTVRNANHQANAMAVANKQVAAATKQQRRSATARNDLAGGTRQDQDHLDLAHHPSRSYRLAQGPRSEHQGQALYVHAGLRPGRLA